MRPQGISKTKQESLSFCRGLSSFQRYMEGKNKGTGIANLSVLGVHNPWVLFRLVLYGVILVIGPLSVTVIHLFGANKE